MQTNEKKKHRALWIIGGVTLAALSIFVIPPALEKLGTKMYKSSLRFKSIDIENLEPEIIKKPNIEEKEEVTE